VGYLKHVLLKHSSFSLNVIFDEEQVKSDFGIIRFDRGFCRLEFEIKDFSKIKIKKRDDLQYNIGLKSVSQSLEHNFV
jgi:hypothetical protein